MKALLLPGDQGACGHYRLAWPGMALSRRDEHDVTLAEPGSVKMRTTRGVLGPSRFEVRGLPDLSDVDVAVVQRLGSENGVRLIQHLQAAGVAVVLDADDAMWAIDPENVSYREWNGRPLHWQWMDEAARLADLVTVTTPLLARRYGREHGRVEVIPNYLPAAALATDGEMRTRVVREGLRVGWAGTLRSHPKDLPEAHPAAHTALNLGASLHVLGDGVGVADAWGLPAEQVQVHGGVALSAYHQCLDVMDVGLVPLVESPFNAAKSWLKALEYAGRGIPSVVSPTPANRALSEWLLGVRVIETPYLWPVTMQDLLASLNGPEARMAVARSLRDEVARSFTIEGNVSAWESAWGRAVSRRRNLTGGAL